MKLELGMLFGKDQEAVYIPGVGLIDFAVDKENFPYRSATLNIDQLLALQREVTKHIQQFIMLEIGKNKGINK